MSNTKQDNSKVVTIDELIEADKNLKLQWNEAEIVLLTKSYKMHMKIDGDNLLLASSINSAMRNSIEFTAILVATTNRYIEAMKNRGIKQELDEFNYHLNRVNNSLDEAFEVLHEALKQSITKEDAKSEQGEVAEAQCDQVQSQEGGDE